MIAIKTLGNLAAKISIPATDNQEKIELAQATAATLAATRVRQPLNKRVPAAIARKAATASARRQDCESSKYARP